MVVLGGLKSLRLSSRGGGEAGALAEDGPDVPGIHWLKKQAGSRTCGCHGAF